MTITPTTPVESGASCAKSAVLTILASHKALTPRVQAFVDGVYADAIFTGIDPFFVVVQAIHETGWFSSTYWLNDGNSGGIGISYSGKPSPFSTQDGLTSAQIHIANLYARMHPQKYLQIIANLPRAGQNAGFQAYQQSVLKLFSAPGAPVIRVWGDFNLKFGVNYTYAADDAYTDKLLAIANAFPLETTMAQTYTTVIPGIGTVKTSFPIYLTYQINTGNGYTNTFSARKRMQPPVWIQHETGSYVYGDSALSEARFFTSGAGGVEESIHFTIDDVAAYCVLSADWMAYQAADGYNGYGNNHGVTCELAVGSQITSDPARLLKSRKNAAELGGVVMKAKEIADKAAAGAYRKPTRHLDYNAADPDRHWCPELMQNEGYWDAHFIADFQAAYDGVPAPVVTPPKTYAPAKIIKELDTYIKANNKNAAVTDVVLDNGVDCIYVYDTYKVVKQVPRRQNATLKSPEVGPVLNPDELVTVLFVFRNPDGLWGYTAYATRVLIEGADKTVYMTRNAD